jgi:hypothetical protein
VADDPARERAVADATPGEYSGDVLSVGATEQVVDAEVEGRPGRAQLVPLLFANDLHHDLLPALVDHLRQRL